MMKEMIVFIALKTPDICFSQQPVHFENPRLFCDFFNNDNPGLLLLPVKREVLSLQPYVVLYHDFVTETEAEDIRRLAQPGVSATIVQFSHYLMRIIFICLYTLFGVCTYQPSNAFIIQC